MLTTGLLIRGVAGISGREAALLAPFGLAIVVFTALSLIYWRFLGRSIA